MNAGQNMTRPKVRTIRASVVMSGHLLAEGVGAELVTKTELLLLGDWLIVRPLRDSGARHAEKPRQLGLAHGKLVKQFGLGHGGT